MALWGLNDNIETAGTITVDGTTVTGTATTFTDYSVGQVIRVGSRESGVGTYYGDAVISGITSDRLMTIDSAAGLSDALTSSISTSYYISDLPLYTVKDSVYQEERSEADSLVYGISTAVSGNYAVAHHGWVGVTTYVDMHGNLRVKSEVLVAQSGIETGAYGIAYPTDE
jgi:hypothetical protein